MDDTPGKVPAKPPTLEEAMRRARTEAAAQGGASDNVREVEFARLEILEDALRPVISQVPRDVDLFDLGKTHGERPRLFIDVIAFVELGPDRKTYRFFQDTRYGRVLIAENADVEAMVAATTNYVARRLVERERALASDWRSEMASPPMERDRNAGGPAVRPTHDRGRRFIGWAANVLNAFFVALGTAVLLAIVLAVVFAVWITWGKDLWFAHFAGLG